MTVNAQRMLELADALEPFAKLAGFAHPDHRDTRPVIFGFDTAIAQRLTIGDLRRAADALAALPPSQEVPARTCASCHAILADGPQPAATYAAPPQCAWAPIETAPKDHFVVLVCGPYGRLTAFRDVNWDWWQFPASDALSYIPTHWMPLPDGPSVTRPDTGLELTQDYYHIRDADLERLLKAAHDACDQLAEGHAARLLLERTLSTLPRPDSEDPT